MTETKQTEATGTITAESIPTAESSAPLDIGMPQQQPIVLLTPKIKVMASEVPAGTPSTT